MNRLAPCDVEATIERLEHTVAAGRRVSGATLSPQAVEALDVVYHALVFAGPPGAIDLWRVALWEGRIADDAREAVRAMLTYLNDAVARGETHRVSEICDCLEDVMGGGERRAHVGPLEPGAGRAPVQA